jgi:hypothetical protein
MEPTRVVTLMGHNSKGSKSTQWPGHANIHLIPKSIHYSIKIALNYAFDLSMFIWEKFTLSLGK